MTTTRQAIVQNGNADTIARYLPSNYRVTETTPEGDVIIEGTDSAGWTLDGYVLPRLASGRIFGKETVTLCDYCGTRADLRLPSDFGKICETCAQDMPAEHLHL